MRFFQPPPWRYVVTDLDSATLTFLDRLMREGKIDFDLNTPSTIAGIVPSNDPEVNILHTDDDPFLAEGNRLLYAFRRDGVDPDPPWTCRAAGTILDVRDGAEAGAPSGTTFFEAADPWAVLYSRPCLDETGDLPEAEGIIFAEGAGPGPTGGWPVGMIALEMMRRSIEFHGTVRIDAGDGSRIGEGIQYDDWEGTAAFDGFIAETSEVDEWTIQRSKTVGELWDDLCATELMDIRLNAKYDPGNRPGYTHEIAICSQPVAIGQPFMKERPDAIFSWDLPPKTLAGISRSIDGKRRANKIQFHNRHGGNAPLSTAAGSVSKYGQYWYEQFFPDQLRTDNARRWGEAQLRMRKKGWREVVPIPNAQQPPLVFEEFDIGDRVPVYASSRLREPLPASGDGIIHRAYGFTIGITGVEGTERLTDIRVSADGMEEVAF